MDQFEIIIPVEKIPSVNSAIKVRKVGNKAWTYLSTDIKNLQEEIKQAMLNSNAINWAKDLNSDYVLYLDLLYVIKKRFWVRDVTNLNKYVEDAIAMAIEFNDAKNLKVNAEKVFNDIDDKEYIIIVITPKLLNSVKYKWGQFIETK